MAKRVSESDMMGHKINEWHIIKYMGDHKLLCECSCGKQKIVSKYDILNGTSTNCGHTRRNDLTNKRFGEWKVIKYIGNNKYICECSCGAIKEVLAQSLINGRSTNCGHVRRLSKNNIESLINRQFNDWTVIAKGSGYKYLCRCSCGEEREVSRYALLSGQSKSCGHNTSALRDLTDKQFGELTARVYIGDGYWKCECSCGKVVAVKGKYLRIKSARSCGHTILEAQQNCSKYSRTEEQKKAVLSAEALKEFIKQHEKMDFRALAERLDITYPHMVKLINKFGLEEYVQKKET